MKSCKEYNELFKKLIAGEINPLDEEELRRHSATCRLCRKMLQAHAQLTQSSSLLPEATDDELLAVRRRVLNRARQLRQTKTATWFSEFLERLRLFIYQPAFAVALSLLLLFSGLMIGKYVLIPATNGTEPALIRQIGYSAQENSSLRQVQDSPYSYSNVRFEDVNHNRIALSFDVTTHLDVVRPKDDALVKEVLAQSLISPQSLGNRLQSISYSEQIMAPKIKEALIFTMLNDANLAVRQKALNSLIKYSNDAQIQAALLSVLQNEESVQMRLTAVEYLAANSVDSRLLEEELKQSQSRNKSTIELKKNKYYQTNN